MQSRLFQFRYSYQRDIADIYAIVTIGASGAPTLQQTSKGVLSVTRNSTGTYTLRLKDSFTKLMMVDMAVQNASGVPDVQVGIIANNITSNSAPSIQIVTSNTGATPAAADPASGDVLLIHIAATSAST